MVHTNNTNNTFQMFPFQISYILGVFFKLCLLKAARRKSYSILGVVVLLPEDAEQQVGSGILPALAPRTKWDFEGGRLG